MNLIMKKLVFLFLLASSLHLSAQDEAVLMTIGNKDITLGEFERIYHKNNNENSLTQQTPEEYLDLFINFKLKVMEAEARGMDTTKSFLKEYNGYADQLAKPYLSDDETKNKLLTEAYERSLKEINASHILLRLDEKASPEDTLAMYEKIMKIRQRILNGEAFDAVAREVSEDPSAKSNGGDLGYFTVFSMVYPFETAAYTTPVGAVSLPVRTRYGYHILQVHDIRPARGTIRVAHIFILSPEASTPEEKALAEKKAFAVYDSIQKGVDFGTLARNNSDDQNSASNGGELPWFGAGRMIPAFEKGAFSLENPGDITKPFPSQIGWHIVKLIDRKPVGSMEESRAELETKTFRGDRMQVNTALYLAKLKNDYHFTEYPENKRAYLASLDTTIFTRELDKAASLAAAKPLFSIGNKVVTTADFDEYIDSKVKRKPGYSFDVFLNEIYNSFTELEIMDYEKTQLPLKYPEYKNILQEYHDGILLFDLMDKMVWSKAVSDTTGLEKYYRKHKKEYMWDTRADALIVTFDNSIDKELVLKYAPELSKGKMDEKALRKAVCGADSIACVTVKELKVEKGVNTAVDQLGMKTGTGAVSASEDQSSFVIVKKILKPMPKELNETRGQVTSDYQDFLEKQWIAELRSKYKVVVNKELLSQVK
ncbi:MAG: peptidylprolyl isomerase [Bacteroidota bacterium]